MRQCLLGIVLLMASTGYCQLSSVGNGRESKPDGSKCTSAIDADGYLYVAGQSGERPDGTVADKFPRTGGPGS